MNKKLDEEREDSLDWFSTVDPVVQALLATIFTWFMTALGAAMVFFFKTINKQVLNGMLGFAAGVMIAASFWSLLAQPLIWRRKQI